MKIDGTEIWSLLCAAAFIIGNLLLFAVCGIRFLIRRRPRNRIVIGTSIFMALAGATCTCLAYSIGGSARDWMVFCAPVMLSLVATVLIAMMPIPSRKPVQPGRV